MSDNTYLPGGYYPILVGVFMEVLRDGATKAQNAAATAAEKIPTAEEAFANLHDEFMRRNTPRFREHLAVDDVERDEIHKLEKKMYTAQEELEKLRMDYAYNFRRAFMFDRMADAHGQRGFATLILLTWEQAEFFGVVEEPKLDEKLMGWDKKGALRNLGAEQVRDSYYDQPLRQISKQATVGRFGLGIPSFR
jgi:hypothetical protein